MIRVSIRRHSVAPSSQVERRGRFGLKVYLLVLLGLFVPANSLAADNSPSVPNGPPWRDGDRIVLLGGGFVERMQAYGYLESLIAASQPDRAVSVRNLGWSGDTASGIARAVFGSPADGFARLEKDVRAARPTVVLIAYGGNQAFRGLDGIDQFKKDLTRLLDMLQATEARIVLLSPHRLIKPKPPLPDPASYNRDLRAYCDVLRATAKRRELTYVDLYDLFAAHNRLDTAGGDPRVPAPGGLTSNGLHLSRLGYWYVAPLIAKRLGLNFPTWQVTLRADGKKVASTGARVSELSTQDGVLRCRVDNEVLGYVRSPTRKPSSHPLAPPGKLSVAGLAPGKYRLTIDGRPVAVADHLRWKAGVALPRRGDALAFEALRSEIVRKNEFCFHQYRPQNETYLFLFRKHEQGNNAVEIRQLDPIIAASEKRIAELARPRSQSFELRRLDD